MIAGEANDLYFRLIGCMECDSTAEGANDQRAFISRIDHWMALRSVNLLRQLGEASTGQHFFFVLSSPDSRIARILMYLARPLVIRRIRHLMSIQRLQVMGTFAVYPSLENCSVAYECGTAAADYAESYVLFQNTNKNRVFRKANALLWRIVGSPISIRHIVVAGKKVD